MALFVLIVSNIYCTIAIPASLQEHTKPQKQQTQRHKNYVLSITTKMRNSKPQQTYALLFTRIGMKETMLLHPIVWTVMQLHHKRDIIFNYRHSRNE